MKRNAPNFKCAGVDHFLPRLHVLMYYYQHIRQELYLDINIWKFLPIYSQILHPNPKDETSVGQGRVLNGQSMVVLPMGQLTGGRSAMDSEPKPATCVCSKTGWGPQKREEESQENFSPYRQPGNLVQVRVLQRCLLNIRVNTSIATKGRSHRNKLHELMCTVKTTTMMTLPIGKHDSRAAIILRIISNGNISKASPAEKEEDQHTKKQVDDNDHPSGGEVTSAILLKMACDDEEDVACRTPGLPKERKAQDDNNDVKVRTLLLSHPRAIIVDDSADCHQPIASLQPTRAGLSTSSVASTVASVPLDR
ncbi:hypothetical protein EI94DRAFT_1708620 [Lactarius quietus]|nr:hypothetical protein EI94DRAFT_1708620 [Lactarius quietus]